MAISDIKLPKKIEEELDGLALDKDEFSQWVGMELAKYKATVDGRALLPRATTEKAAIKRFIRSIKELAQFLEPGGLPPRINALLVQLGSDQETGFKSQRAQILEKLNNIQVMAESAEIEASKWVSTKGSRSRKPRDQLLAAIVQRVYEAGANKETARAVAESVLISLQIPVPSGERSLRRAENRSPRKGHK